MLHKAITKVQRDGFWSLLRRAPSYVANDLLFKGGGKYLYRTPVTYYNRYVGLGMNVYERDWDILVVLDTCRVDALSAVADEYSFLDEVDSIWSVGSQSAEFIAATFREPYRDEIQNTAYLTANPYAEYMFEEEYADESLGYPFCILTEMDTVDLDTLGTCEYLFRYEPRGEEGSLGHIDGSTPPRYVTNRAITHNRDSEFDRLVLHYMQPHFPYFSNALKENRELRRYERGGRREGWIGHLQETGDRASIWEAYLDDLRYVLDDVKLLLENVDAETVAITADHGESFGEFGVYGHSVGHLHPKLRIVPWVTTTAEDTGSYTPEIEVPETSDDSSDTPVAEQLQALGYQM